MKRNDFTTHTRKISAVAALFLVLCFAFTACAGTSASSASSAANSVAPSLPVSATSLPLVSFVPPALVENTVRFSAVGDNLIHDGIYLQAQRRAGGTGYDFAYVYENVKPFFSQFDVNWINQETLVNNELEPSTYPCFSTPGELGQAAYDAGWRVFSMSNNHSYDKGAAGISATLRFWQAMPADVVTTGFFTNDEDDSGIALQQVNGVTIAYLSYTDYTNGIPTPANAEAHIIYTSQQDVMERQIRRANELADVVLVGVHWGVEGSHTVTQAQKDLAAKIAAWGADAIIGTHPHVIQPIEWIQNPEDGRNVLVAYSLGNFLSAQSAANNMVGLALTFTIHQVTQPDGTKEPATITDVKVYPTVTHYDTKFANIRDYMLADYTPELAAAHGVRERNPEFSLEYINTLIEELIAPEFIAQQ